MKKCFLFLFLLILIVGFLVLPDFGMAKTEKTELNDEEVTSLRNDIQKMLTKEAEEMWADSDFVAKNQCVLTVVREGLRDEVISHFFRDVPGEFAKNIVKNTFKIAYSAYGGKIPDIIGQLEKWSVKTAIKELDEYLERNKIKTKAGTLDQLSYLSYEEIEVTPKVQFIMTVKSTESLGEGYYKMVAEFYSPNVIKSPKNLNKTYCGMKGEIDPFILRIKGDVKEIWGGWGGYKWAEGSRQEIEVIFDQIVPEFDVPQKLSFWEGVKDDMKNFLEDSIDDVKSLLSNLKDVFGASAGKSLEGIGQNIELADLSEEEELEVIIIIQEVIEEEKKLTSPKIEEKKPTLEELMKIFEDIAKELDIIDQQLKEIADGSSDDEDNEEEEKEDEKKETKKTTKKKAVSGGGTTVVPINYCEKSLDAEASKDVIIINEIAWMGSDSSSNDEWMELKNITDEPVDILNWQLLDKANQIKVILSGTIPAGGFYLLERTDDDSVPEIPADNIYTGGLNDSNETISLFNNECQLQDEVIADSDWEAGDKTERRTMERDDGGWHTYSGIGEGTIMGTPNMENSSIPYPEYSEIAWPMFQNDSSHLGRSLSLDISEEETLEEGWSYEMILPEFTTLRTSNIVIDNNGVIYFGVGEGDWGKVYAINPGGTLKWESEDLGNVPIYLAIGLDGTIYFSVGPTLYAFDLEGVEKWAFTEEEIGWISGITISSDNTIYFTTGDDLYSVSSDGTKNWSNPDSPRGGSSVGGPAIGSDGTIYVSWTGFITGTDGERGKLVAHNPEDGEIKWYKRLVKGRAGAPVVSPDGTIYVIVGNPGYFGTSRQIIAFDSEGTELWRTGGEYGSILTSAVLDDKVVVLDYWREVAGESWGLYVWEPMSRIRAFNFEGEDAWISGPNSSQSISGFPVIDTNGNIFFQKKTYEKHIGGMFDGWGFEEVGQSISGINPQGEIKWDVPIEGSFVSSMVAGSNNLYMIISQGDNIKLISYSPVLLPDPVDIEPPSIIEIAPLSAEIEPNQELPLIEDQEEENSEEQEKDAEEFEILEELETDEAEFVGKEENPEEVKETENGESETVELEVGIDEVLEELEVIKEELEAEIEKKSE